MLSTPAHDTKHGSQDRTTPAAPRLRKAAPSDAPQASLAVSEPGDALEVEADRIAEQVTSPSAGDVPRPSNAAAPVVQRACSVPSGCPSDFCTPFSSTTLATIERAAIAPALLAGIAAKVSPRVVGRGTQ